MLPRNYYCAASIVVVAWIVFQHTAWAQSNRATTRRQELIAWCSGTEHFGLCLSLLPDIEETHRRQPFSAAELEQIELNVVRDVAERSYLGEQHRKLLDLSYTRSGFNPQIEELVRATRSEDTRERYRAVMHLQYLSRSDLPPPAWRAAADVMRDPRNDYLISMMAANMLAAHRQRGGPDITQVFFEAMRDNPRCADPFASERRADGRGARTSAVGARQVRPGLSGQTARFPRLAAFRQRRARLRELDYDSPTAQSSRRAVDSAT